VKIKNYALFNVMEIVENIGLKEVTFLKKSSLESGNLKKSGSKSVKF